MKKLITNLSKVVLLVFILSIAIQAQAKFWDQLNINVNAYIYALIITPQGRIYVGTDKGIFVSADSGKTWTARSTGLPSNKSVTSLASDIDGNVYAGVWNGGAFKQSYTDTAWTAMNDGLTQLTVTSVAVNPADSTIFLGTAGGGVYYIRKAATTWTKVDTSLSDSHTECLLIDTVNHNVYAGTWSGLFRSTDGGNTWARMGATTSFIIYSMAINSKGYVFAGCTNYDHIFRSTDGGNTWEAKGTVWGDSLVSNIIVNRNDVIYKSSAYGVSCSLDDGDTWIPITGINTVVSFLALDVNSYLYAGTQNGTVYRSVTSTVTGIKDKGNPLPDNFELYQNYPNPFNPTTTLSFVIGHQSFVTLKVYDILGNEVSTLVKENKPAGTYSIQFNAEQTISRKQLASGIYFYQLRAGSFVETRKMILVK